MAGPTNAPEPKMDVNDLYREDIYSDRKVGTIRVLTPVKPDGTPDPARATLRLRHGQRQLRQHALDAGDAFVRFFLDAVQHEAGRLKPCDNLGIYAKVYERLVYCVRLPP